METTDDATFHEPSTEAPESPVAAAISAPANGKPAKASGGPSLNLNAAKTCTRVRPLVIGELPAKLKRCVERPAMKYRRYLETAVENARGEISLEDHHNIDLAVGNYVLDAVCRWLLKNKFDSLSPAEVRTNSETQIGAKEARNKAVAKLKLGPPGAEAESPSGWG